MWAVSHSYIGLDIGVGYKLITLVDSSCIARAAVAHYTPWLILDLHRANGRRRYKVTPSPIGWAQTKDQPCIHYVIKERV